MKTPLILSIVLAAPALLILLHKRLRSKLVYWLTTALFPNKTFYKDVKFTASWPRFVASGEWHKMLAFAQLVHPGTDDAGRKYDPEQMVQKQIEESLGEASEHVTRRDEDSRFAVPHEAAITFEPSAEGITFNPPTSSFLWQPPVETQTFRFRPESDLEGQTVEGTMKVSLGLVLLAEIQLSIRVNRDEAQKEQTVFADGVTAKPYDKILVPNARKDPHVDNVRRTVVLTSLILLISSVGFALNAFKEPLTRLFNQLFKIEQPKQQEPQPIASPQITPLEPTPSPTTEPTQALPEVTKVDRLPARREQPVPAPAIVPNFEHSVYGRALWPDGSALEGARISLIDPVTGTSSEARINLSGYYELQLDPEASNILVTIQIFDPETGELVAATDVTVRSAGELNFVFDKDGRIKSTHYKAPKIDLSPLNPLVSTPETGNIRRYESSIGNSGGAAHQITFEVTVPKQMKLVRARLMEPTVYDFILDRRIGGAALEELRPSLIRSDKSKRVYSLVESFHPERGAEKIPYRILLLETRLKEGRLRPVYQSVELRLVSFKDQRGRVIKADSQP